MVEFRINRMPIEIGARPTGRDWEPIAHLEMHPTKTKIVYCKDKKRKGAYPNVNFDFLEYCFRRKESSWWWPP
jgi:hypothetical protein